MPIGAPVARSQAPIRYAPGRRGGERSILWMTDATVQHDVEGRSIRRHDLSDGVIRILISPQRGRERTPRGFDVIGSKRFAVVKFRAAEPIAIAEVSVEAAQFARRPTAVGRRGPAGRLHRSTRALRPSIAVQKRSIPRPNVETPMLNVRRLRTRAQPAASADAMKVDRHIEAHSMPKRRAIAGDLLDRDGLIADVNALSAAVTADGDAAVVRLVGPPGIGKTALCAEFLRRARLRGELTIASAALRRKAACRSQSPEDSRGSRAAHVRSMQPRAECGKPCAVG